LTRPQSEHDPEQDLDDALYADDPVARDGARARLAERAEAATVAQLVALLDAPRKATRRRAGRIIAEMRRERVLPHLERALDPGATASDRLRAAAARSVSLLGEAGAVALERALGADSSARVRVAAATRATPVDALRRGLSDADDAVARACFDALLERGVAPSPDACAALSARLGAAASDEVTRAAASAAPTTEATRAAALAGAPAALDHLACGETWRALFDAPTTRRAAAWALADFAPEALRDALSRDDPALRAATIRALGGLDAAVLAAGLADPDPTVRWHARRVAAGDFDRLDDRTRPHARSEAPSARPPFGLAAHDASAAPPRVSASLALCHTRLDVNLGVAVRSAEACGLDEVVLVGRGDLLRTATRGTERALRVRALPDAAALMRDTRERGRQLVVVQQTPRSVAYHRAEYPPNPVFVLGAEDDGVPARLRRAADLLIEIPMWGAIDSLNVATAATCVLFHWRAHAEA